MSVWQTRPATIADLTGLRAGELSVTGMAQRKPEVYWWVRCGRCGSTFRERHSLIMAGGLHCKSDLCQLNRLPVRKTTAHEEWLNSPEPEPEPQPTPAPEPIKRPEVQQPVDPGYRRYWVHATAQKWQTVHDYVTWLRIGDSGQRYLLAAVDEEENAQHA